MSVDHDHDVDATLPTQPSTESDAYHAAMALSASVRAAAATAAATPMNVEAIDSFLTTSVNMLLQHGWIKQRTIIQHMIHQLGIVSHDVAHIIADYMTPAMRQAWRPKTSPINTSTPCTTSTDTSSSSHVHQHGPGAASSILRTKLYGTPYLSMDESWPTCMTCGQHLFLLQQVSLFDLPSCLSYAFPDMEPSACASTRNSDSDSRHVTSTWLLQLWCCPGHFTICSTGKCTAAQPQVVRCVRAGDTQAQHKVVCPSFGTPSPSNWFLSEPECEITWEPMEELDEPHMEHDTHPHTTQAVALLLSSTARRTRASMGCKLAGFPWFGVNHPPSYPTCPEPDCVSTNMAFVMQLWSGYNEMIPVIWGDQGALLIFICPHHPQHTSTLITD